jgi:hypothetical protein
VQSSQWLPMSVAVVLGTMTSCEVVVIYAGQGVQTMGRAATVFDDCATSEDDAASIPIDVLDWAACLELEAETATASASRPSAVKPSRADEHNLFFTRAENEESEVEKRNRDEGRMIFFLFCSYYRNRIQIRDRP